MRSRRFTRRPEAYLLNFCPICLAAITLPRDMDYATREVRWDTKFPVRMHLLCRRLVAGAGVPADGKHLQHLIKTEASMWPLNDGMHNASAAALIASRMLSSFSWMSARDELIKAIMTLPVEIRLIIINYSIPSLLAAFCSAEYAIPLLRLHASAVRQITLNLQRWPRFAKSVINGQSYITDVDVKHHTGPRSPDTTFVLQFDDTGCKEVFERQSLQRNIVLSDIRRSISSCFRLVDADLKTAPKMFFKGSVIRDISDRQWPSVYWDTPHTITFDPKNCIDFWEHDTEYGRGIPIRMRLLDNIRPLVGITVLTDVIQTQAVILHHEHDNINLLPRLVKCWPGATVQYWPLQRDHILNFGYRSSHPPLTEHSGARGELYFVTTNGLMIQSGEHLPAGRPRWFSPYIYQKDHFRPGYLAMNDPDEFDAFLRLGAAVDIPVTKSVAPEDVKYVNDSLMWRQPEEIILMGGIYYWMIDTDDGYDQCYIWYRDATLGHINGIMFESLDGQKKAVLGQWRQDCKPTGPLLLSDGILVQNVFVRDYVCVSEKEYAVMLAEESAWSMKLSGKIRWWGGRTTNMISATKSSQP